MQPRQDYCVEVNEHPALWFSGLFSSASGSLHAWRHMRRVGKHPHCFWVSSLNGVVKWELYKKVFMKIFFFFNLHLILFVYFIMTAKSHGRMDWRSPRPALRDASSVLRDVSALLLSVAQ